MCLAEEHRNLVAGLEGEAVSVLTPSLTRDPPIHTPSPTRTDHWPLPWASSSHLGVRQGDLGLQFLHLLLQLFLLLIHALPIAALSLEVLLKDLHLEGEGSEGEG